MISSYDLMLKVDVMIWCNESVMLWFRYVMNWCYDFNCYDLGMLRFDKSYDLRMLSKGVWH